jgi:diacylglycerol kinase (ATP)
MLVVVNGSSRGAQGASRWGRARRALMARGLSFDEVAPPSVEDSAAAIRRSIADGQKTIVAAGGDGTVNAALNAIMDPATDRPIGDVALGAVGLGSSNDFHKPMRDERSAAGFPVRVSRDQGQRVDVGKATLRHTDGSKAVRYFLLNASMGIVAEGNAFFNEGDSTVRLLKKGNTEVAILYSAFVNIARHQAQRVRVTVDDYVALDEPVVNVGVLKSVHFAGGMRYDTPVTRDDGSFDVNVWTLSSRARIVGTMVGLYGGRFQGRPATKTFRGRSVQLTPEAPAHLELDGEIVKVASAELTVLPKALFVCG